MNRSSNRENQAVPSAELDTENPKPPKKPPELRRDQRALDVVLAIRPVLRINSIGEPQIQLPLNLPGDDQPDKPVDATKFHDLSHSRVRAEIAYLVLLETRLILHDQEINRLLTILEGMAWKSPHVESELQQVLDESPLGEAIYLLLMQPENAGQFQSSGTGLLEALQLVGNRKGVDLKSKDWPRSASILSRRLQELRAPLQKLGIEVSVGRKGGGDRYVSLNMTQEIQQSVPCDDGIKLPSQLSPGHNTNKGGQINQCDNCSDEQKLRMQRLISK
jgi:hypothetical protein